MLRYSCLYDLSGEMVSWSDCTGNLKSNHLYGEDGLVREYLPCKYEVNEAVTSISGSTIHV